MTQTPTTTTPHPPSPTPQDDLWGSVLSRDARADGRFVYGVRSTKIYCRPSCPSRRPRREGVCFFPGPDAAEVAGFRECRRCRARAGAAPAPGLAKIQKACAYIAARVGGPITLARVAAHVGTSACHLQRTFTRLVGLSPRLYHEALRAARFRSELRGGVPVAGAIYSAGYGSSSRVYERHPTGRGMTPAAYRQGGAGARVTYTITASPLGRLLVAGTAKGLCAVKLGDRDQALEEELRGEFAGADVTRDRSALAGWVDALVAHLEGRLPHLDLPVDVRATAFQWNVWRCLQSIPYGATRSYSDVARAIGSPTAVRAVARACATNQVCLVIPCHRVVQKDGGLAGYRWGVERKGALLRAEREGIQHSGSTMQNEQAKTGVKKDGR